MLTRRNFLKLMGAAYAGVALGALSFDAIVNGGHPAESNGEEEEPPN